MAALDLFGEPIAPPRGRGRPSHVPTEALRAVAVNLLAEGRGRQEIARALGLTVPTLLKHYGDACGAAIFAVRPARPVHCPTDETRGLVRDLRRSGATSATIARALGIGIRTLERRYRQQIGCRKPRHVPTEAQRIAVEAMRAQGAGQPAIAKALAIAVPTLARHYRAELGAKRRRHIPDQVTRDEVRTLSARGLSAVDIARALGIGRSTLIRYYAPAFSAGRDALAQSGDCVTPSASPLPGSSAPAQGEPGA